MPATARTGIASATLSAAILLAVILSAVVMSTELPDDPQALCQSCGACCAFSRTWPRFSLEDDADLARIPAALVDETQNRMRCHGDRCSALRGDVGVATACTIYAARPDVCRACLPGDDACRMARNHFNLPTRGALFDET
jgi:uncharacterized protein